MARRFSRYSPLPSPVVIFRRPMRPQKAFHQALCVWSRLAVVASLPRSWVATVAAAVLPLNLGEPQTTRNEPSAFGLNETEMVRPFAVAVTPCAPAVSAASEPNFWFEEYVAPELLSVQVSDSTPIVADAVVACGLRVMLF